jgi:polar amino acid transport system permease protein
VHPSQRAGALAVGLTERQAMRHVIVPQAVRRVMPPLLNDFIRSRRTSP